MCTSNLTKELILCHKPNIFATQCGRPDTFETINIIGSNHVIFNSQMVTQSGCKGIGIRKF